MDYTLTEESYLGPWAKWLNYNSVLASLLIFFSFLLIEMEKNTFARSVAAEIVPEAILFCSNRNAASGNSICT